MRLPQLARSTHKWLALIIAVQAVLWTLSGIYMTAVHIDIIHGDRLIRTIAPQPIDVAGLMAPADIAAKAPAFMSAKLDRQLGIPVYVVKTEGGSELFDAGTGEKLSPLGKAAAQARAEALFSESGKVVKVEYLTKAPPEIRTGPVPIWRVEFEGAWRPTLYISPQTGELITRRHDLWRAFDFVWMLHIMDYDDREDVNNILLRVFTWLAVGATATGAWLLFYSFRRKRSTHSAA